jgi:hypothetical protein
MTVDAYTDEKKFLSLPDMPAVFDYGLKVDLVSFAEGKVVVRSKLLHCICCLALHASLLPVCPGLSASLFETHPDMRIIHRLMQDMPHLETIKKLRSWMSFDMLPAVGDKISKTVRPLGCSCVNFARCCRC